MFISGCKANNDTYKTAKNFLTANSYMEHNYSFAIATQFAHGLTCEFLPNLNGSPYLGFNDYVQKHMAHMQHKMTLPDLRYTDLFRLRHSILKL